MAKDAKQFATELYESCVFDQLLGETLRPGGLELTNKLAKVVGICQNHHILDIGCGKGATAIFLAKEYHCRVTGIDLSDKMISFCRSKTAEGKLADRVSFLVGDGERLPFGDSSFDAVISESSFSLLPNKQDAAGDMRRVLKSGGRLVIADVILRGKVDKKLQSQITFPCCLTGAWQLEEYIQLFEQIGFQPFCIEDRSEELEELSYRLGMTFGSIDNFLGVLSAGPCQQKRRGISSPSIASFRDFLKLGRPGYALIAMTKM